METPSSSLVESARRTFLDSRNERMDREKRVYRILCFEKPRIRRTQFDTKFTKRRGMVGERSPARLRYFRYSVIDFPSVRKLLFAIQPADKLFRRVYGERRID